MPSPVLIRAAAVQDAAPIAAIVAEIPWFDPRLSGPEGPSLVAVHLEQSLARDDGLVLVAEAAGRARGYLSAHWLSYMILPAPELYISELFIASDWRGRGLGSRLLAAAEDHARSRGASRLMLITGRGRECYERGFYPGRGWTERPLVANFVREM